MKILLVEDEIAHCEKYQKCVEYLPYKVELSVANGYKKAVKLATGGGYNIIFLDLELAESDGDGIIFLEWLKTAKLEIAPYVIIITNNRSYATHKIVRELGADYIFTKNKPKPHWSIHAKTGTQFVTKNKIPA